MDEGRARRDQPAERSDAEAQQAGGPDGGTRPDQTPPEPLTLTGGTTTVTRIGDTVRRPRRSWSPATRALLDRYTAAGIAGTPRWRGSDELGRDVLDFLPGEVGSYPLTAAVRSETALVTAAHLLRSIHDASRPLVDADLPWQFPPLTPVEVVCHGDFAPYNCVFTDGKYTGVFDFDTAHPGPRSWDLAYALYRFAPLTHPDNPDGFGTTAEQGRRARLFLDAYGCDHALRVAALEAVAGRLERLVGFITQAAAAGDPHFARHLAEGHVDLYRRDIGYVEASLTSWRRALS